MHVTARQGYAFFASAEIRAAVGTSSGERELRNGGGYDDVSARSAHSSSL